MDRLWRYWRYFKALINGIWKIITFPFWLFYELYEIFSRANTKQLKLDALKSIISAVGLIATVFAAIGLFFNYTNAAENIHLAQENIELTQKKLVQDREDAELNRQLNQERLITDRFTNAVEQIGRKKQDEVVIGGIYSLERIAQDSHHDQWRIMEVLTAFVRKNSNEIERLDDEPCRRRENLEKLSTFSIKLQAALTVIKRRNPKYDYDNEKKNNDNEKKNNDNEKKNNQIKIRKRINLSNSNLKDAYLRDAHLGDAYLRNAYLRCAYLRDAYLSKAKFFRANLSDANLKGANLSDANLIDADLRDANLIDADLEGADFENANLEGADFENANLEGADLENANLFGTNNLINTQIKSACFWDKAIFTAAKWNEKAQKWVIQDEQANQKKIDEIRQDKASDLTKPPDCSKWG